MKPEKEAMETLTATIREQDPLKQGLKRGGKKMSKELKIAFGISIIILLLYYFF